VRRLLLLCALARCSCDPKLDLDGGFRCVTELDCAEGFACIAGVCGLGGTGGGMGGGSGGGSGGATLWGGLALVTPARSAVVKACSQPLVFELRDDAGVSQSAPFDVAVQMSSDPSMAFYADDTCTTATSFVTVPKGAAGGSFHFVGMQPGLFLVTLSSPPLDPASQRENLVPQGMTSVVFTTAPPQETLAGTCEGPLTVQLQDPAGNPQPAGTDGLSLDLMLSPAGATAYLDARCALAAGPTLNVAPGQSSVSFWVRGVTGATYTVDVGGAGLHGGEQMLSFAPLVQRGVCDMLSPSANVLCPISPPLRDRSRTLLLYQATGASTYAQRVETSCVLRDESFVHCARFDTAEDVLVTWQTIELPGAHVDRYEAACLGDGGLRQTIGLDASVPASSVFTVLASNARGSDPNANDFFTVNNDGTQLTLSWEQQCAAAYIQAQVVQWPWANVVRTSGALAPMAAADSQGVGDADGGFFVLGTWRSDAPVGATSVLCDRLVRPAASMNSTLDVTRGAGNVDPLCTGTSITGYELERVDLGPHATTRQLVVSMDAGTTTVTVAVPPIDATRTFLLASGQSGGLGQGAGEGALVRLSDGGAPLGEVGAVLTFSDPTHVQVTRGAANDSATFSVFVVEIEP
jgi:hypothetical protein